MIITYDDFSKIDIRSGKIIHIEDFERAKKPAYRVKVDLGFEIGIKSSSVQAKNVYTKEELLGMDVICVVNFPAKNIAGFMSEVLILGVPCEDDSLSLLIPSRNPIKLGAKVY